jgi:hypothetical protein
MSDRAARGRLAVHNQQRGGCEVVANRMQHRIKAAGPTGVTLPTARALIDRVFWRWPRGMQLVGQQPGHICIARIIKAYVQLIEPDVPVFRDRSRGSATVCLSVRACRRPRLDELSHERLLNYRANKAVVHCQRVSAHRQC